MGIAIAVSGLLGFYLYRAALTQGEQFGFRDQASYYYPLYLRVQQEWSAGRWPLWDAGQNGGMPLLGNPTAAVLYLPKLIYAILPYAWAARVYVMVHTVIAFGGMLWFSRTLGTSWAGSLSAALAYAFGGAVLFQTCNVIYLVGAAWIPWGLGAIDVLIRKRRAVCMAGLGSVLALQVMGGDPEAAYLTGACGAAYAVLLSARSVRLPSRCACFTIIVAVIAGWAIVAAGLAYAWPSWLRGIKPMIVGVVIWSIVLWLMIWRRRGELMSRIWPSILAIGGSGLLAFLLASAQVVPALEFMAGGRRAAGMNGSEIFRFGLEPLRLAELIWPNVFGVIAPENRWWANALPPSGDHDPWDSSIYLGCMIPLLAVIGVLDHRRVPGRIWLIVIAIFGLAAGLGKYGGPLWWLRFGPFASLIGTHDPLNGIARSAETPGDGFGSVYSILMILLPGFETFRYPGKFSVLLAAAIAALAGMGWDRVVHGNAGKLFRMAAIGCGLSGLLLLLAVVFEQPAVDWLRPRVTADLVFGPPNVSKAWGETQRSLLHGTVMLASIVGIAWLARGRPRMAAVVAISLLAVDLGVANSRLVLTVPQADFEIPSEAARVIAELERERPAGMPFRIHRTLHWSPIPHFTTTTPERLRELNRWEQATLNPLSALPLGLEYCETIGNLELEDYRAFFGVQEDMPCPPSMSATLRVAADSPVIYLARRGYDLWGARYLILPAWASWNDPQRGFAAFVPKTDLVYPDRDTLLGKKPGPDGKDWAREHDWQILRNKSALPRAWVVHSARLQPVAPTQRAREQLMDTLLYHNDPFLFDPMRIELNVRESAIIETGEVGSLRRFAPGTGVNARESVKFVVYEPQRIELEARLESPGFVILADTFYPGWRLEIDGKPATIHRANRLMRGAAVTAGIHRLVYRYDPLSFRIGLGMSGVGVFVLGIVAWRGLRGQGLQVV
jgi:hypothetical protein